MPDIDFIKIKYIFPSGYLYFYYNPMQIKLVCVPDDGPDRHR